MRNILYHTLKCSSLICYLFSQLHFKNPRSWEEKPATSYVYIMCPWISKYQWHAFTMFPEPQKENHTMLCIGASGDWTKELHERIKAPCYRQMYVIGPFKSQFADTAVSYHVIAATFLSWYYIVSLTPFLQLRCFLTLLLFRSPHRMRLQWLPVLVLRQLYLLSLTIPGRRGSMLCGCVEIQDLSSIFFTKLT